MANADIRQLEMEGRVFYPQTDLNALVNNGGYAIDDEPTQYSTNLVKSDSVYRIKSETLQENREMVNSIMENYAPVEITGNVTNASDEEDLTSTNVSGSDVLKFKDKAYNPIVYSGMGKKILRKNMVNGVNTLTQNMINDENTIYVIQYDFVLGENITIPANCVLKFEGGSINGEHTITGNNTRIDTGLMKIFGTDTTFSGTWNIVEIFPQWFGVIGDNSTDNTSYFQKAIDFSITTGIKLMIPIGIYRTSTLNIWGSIKIEGVDCTDNYVNTFTDLRCSTTLFNVTYDNFYNIEQIQITAKNFKVQDTNASSSSELIVFNVSSNRGVGHCLFDNICVRFAKYVWFGYYADGSRFVNCRTSNIINSVFKCNSKEPSVLQDSYILNCSFSGGYNTSHVFDGFVSGDSIIGCFIDYFDTIFTGYYVDSVVFVDNNVNLFFYLSDYGLRYCIIKNNVFTWNNLNSLNAHWPTILLVHENDTPAIIKFDLGSSWNNTSVINNICRNVDDLFVNKVAGFDDCTIKDNTGFTNKVSYNPVNWTNGSYYIQGISDLNFSNIRVVYSLNNGPLVACGVPKWLEIKTDNHELLGVALYTSDGAYLISTQTKVVKWSNLEVGSGNYLYKSLYEATKDKNGKENTITQVNNPNAGCEYDATTNSGAPGYCYQFGTNKIPAGNWWLPSLSQAILIQENLIEINKVLTAISGNTIGNIIASSTEGTNGASAYHIYDGLVTTGSKKYINASTIPITSVSNDTTPIIYDYGTKRPAYISYLKPGFIFFDTSIGKPIWWNGSDWVDATGNAPE